MATLPQGLYGLRPPNPVTMALVGEPTFGADDPVAALRAYAATLPPGVAAGPVKTAASGPDWGKIGDYLLTKSWPARLAGGLWDFAQAAGPAIRNPLGGKARLGEMIAPAVFDTAVRAVTIPGDVYAGKVDPNSDEGIARANDLAGLVTLGSGAVPAGANTLRTGAKIAKAAPDEPAGIRGYHASPHDFDKFDMSKIGTGEGAQTYGHGLYVAENVAVSGRGGQYDKQFASNPRYLQIGDERVPVPQGSPRGKRGLYEGMPADERALYLAANSEGALQTVRNAIRSLENGVRPTSFQREAGWGDLDILRETEKRLLDLKAKGARPADTRIYEVKINASPDEFLDWDKPLEGQVPAVKNKLISYTDPITGERRGFSYDARVENILAEMDTNPEGAIKKLNALGIKGIRYRDAGSRSTNISEVDAGLLETAERQLRQMEREKAASPSLAAEFDEAIRQLTQERDRLRRRVDPSRNYVVFDDNIIEILRKYGIAGLIGGAAGAATMLQPGQAEAAPMQNGLFGLRQ